MTEIFPTYYGTPNWEKHPAHTTHNEIVRQQYEILSQDFTHIMNTPSSLNTAVFISGCLPPVTRGVESLSRLLALN